MTGPAKTRTQRRMEKRQAVILLVLVLAVSLASFALGVIVGRRGAERDLAQKIRQTERVLVTQAPVAEKAPVPPKEPVEQVVTEGDELPEAKDTRLSFYEDLSKEKAPLGSGINLAPVEEKAEEPAATPPIKLPEQPIVVKKAEEVAAVAEKKEEKLAAVVEPVAESQQQPGAELPKVAPSGSHAVQIGSFNAAADAIALKKRMLDKEYPAFVVEADLGTKGLWYRVRIGPYADATVAKKVQAVLEEKEKIKGFVSRQ